MIAPRRQPSPLRRAALAAALGVGMISGLVAAQPVPPPTAGPPPEETPDEAPPQTSAEDPPPVNVPPPEPISVPPVKEEEVAPAPPPKAQVAEKPVVEPPRRPRYDVAVLQALDKVTAETLRFEAAVGRPVRWKGLVFMVRACERSAPDEAIQDSIVYLTVNAQARPQPGKATPAAREAFRGWMYAASPSLNAMEHPTYDVWAIACRASAPVMAPAAANRPSPASARPSLR